MDRVPAVGRMSNAHRNLWEAQAAKSQLDTSRSRSDVGIHVTGFNSFRYRRKVEAVNRFLINVSHKRDNCAAYLAAVLELTSGAVAKSWAHNLGGIRAVWKSHWITNVKSEAQSVFSTWGHFHFAKLQSLPDWWMPLSISSF